MQSSSLQVSWRIWKFEVVPTQAINNHVLSIGIFTDKYLMQLQVYVNGELVSTLAVAGPGYDPVAVINQIKQVHPVEMGDQIKIIPSHQE